MIKKAIKITLGGLICLIVSVLICALLTVFVIPYLYITPTNYKNPNWMKDVSGDKYISELVLPGTHNSSTNICDLPFFTKTQSLDIKDQLEIGVRTFDMRISVDKNNIKLTHNGYACRKNLFENLYLDYICDLMYDFLDENSSETIIFLAKDEPDPQDIELLKTTFKEIIKDKETYWFLEDRIPTLDEVRGKIVFLTRFNTDFSIDAYWNDQGNEDNVEASYELIDKGDYAICVQDRYKYKVDAKWQAFTSELPIFSKNTLVFNYLSTTEGYLSSPQYITPKLNKKFKNYSIPSSFKGSIMLDFIDCNLVDKIIKAN